jgi:hypothetical protein
MLGARRFIELYARVQWDITAGTIAENLARFHGVTFQMQV